jgi:hypothetical protein
MGKKGLFLKRIILTSLVVFSCIYSQAQQRSNKRGLAYDIPYSEDIAPLSKGISWFYNWGQTPGLKVANVYDNYLEFVPMAWNGLDSNVMKNFYSSHPEAKYILGFNEPNFKSQANLTPTQAAAKWKLIERIASLYNLKIVGPAVNYASSTGAVSENGVVYTDPVQYLDDFFKACPDCKVDYIAVHCYMNNVSALQSYIERFKKYNKPIWLTEFCAYEQNQGLTPDGQKDYLVDALNYLENDTCIFRYAWFIGRNGGGDNAFPYNSLLTKNDRGVLTELGDIYINMSSFDKSLYYTDRDVIQAEDFIDAHSVGLRRVDATSGNLYLNNFYFKDWATYQINLPESKEYEVTMRIACIDETVIQMLDSAGNILSSTEIPATAGLSSWSYRTFRLSLPAGKQRITLKSMGEGCNIDWLSFGKVDTTAIANIVTDVNFHLFPNPVEDILNIETNESNFKILIFDTFGRCLYKAENEKSINMDKLKEGIYLVQLISNSGKKQISRIIKVDTLLK